MNRPPTNCPREVACCFHLRSMLSHRSVQGGRGLRREQWPAFAWAQASPGAQQQLGVAGKLQRLGSRSPQYDCRCRTIPASQTRRLARAAPLQPQPLVPRPFWHVSPCRHGDRGIVRLSRGHVRGTRRSQPAAPPATPTMSEAAAPEAAAPEAAAGGVRFTSLRKALEKALEKVGTTAR